ncbi:hypothetical protein NPS01_26310 [Nocardioides psychrotolerans]|uniref:Lipoprotein n=1 Tax=Nocardioides psychrotolerans TaxID=1005945 RepID=A0A1I3LYY2_9ACTN|nr:hypothetical protein [Nocardioides psychrotolerans]GEP38968.1 hypothetical protein NPS01_26310 [Nocardioides psychrotolerans]SFI90001.1 hypothetical protein SAMN05216561_114138 [Nocardioides psychrotolerans]
MRIKPSRKSIAGIAGLLLLAAPLAACGNDDDAGSGKAPTPVAAIDDLSGGETTAIKLDKGFTDALASLKLTPGVLGSAKLTDGSLIFPITGGNVTIFTPGEVSPYVIGQIAHESSGLSLEAGGTTVELRNLNVDPGVSRVYGDVVVNGEVAVTSAYLFRLNGSTLKDLQTEGDTAILEGTKVFISDVAAGLLNDTFKTDAVTDQLLVGVAKITVKVPS